MRKLRILLIFMLVVLSAAGCNSGYNNKKNAGKTTKSPYITENTELPIYTIDENTYECIPSVAVVQKDSKVDAELIVNEVIANFKENVVVLNIEEKDNAVIVSFSKNAAPVVNVSSQMELSMLDCIAYSLLDNLNYCREVYFMCGTDNYRSANLELDKNEPYISK